MNLGDDSPYLPAGTEVSAKFKGAFCEAKIKKVEKCVKCKITLKQGGEQLTVSDEAIRNAQGLPLPLNEFKAGSVVYFSKHANQLANSQVSDSSSSNSGGSASVVLTAEQVAELQPATLNKCTDQSLYAVIFNDGDEKTTRRSFIRFKGTGKPLAVGNAVLGGAGPFIAGGAALLPPVGLKSDDENDDNSGVHEDERKTRAGGAPPAPGSVATSKQTADLNDVLNLNEEEETGEPGEDEEHGDEAGGGGGGGGHGHDDDEDSSDSEDYPSEEKDRFVAQLYKFMDDRGTPMNKVPSIQNVDLDLHKFFIVVKRYGGYNKVNKQRTWYDVYRRLSLPNITQARNLINLKCAYKRYLQPYEDFYRKLGSNFCDFPSLRNAVSISSKRLNDSHRSHQLFKNRVVSTPSTTASQKKPAVGKVKQQQQQTKQQSSCPTLGSSSAGAGKESAAGLDATPKLSAAESGPMKRSSSATGTNLNEEMLGANDYKEQAPTLSSIVAEGIHAMTPTRLNDDQPEEITLSSMFRNIAEESKKAKESSKKEKEKKNDDDSADSPVASVKNEPGKGTSSAAAMAPQLTGGAKASAATPSLASASSSSSKSKTRRGSVDVVKSVQKISLFGTTERLSTKSDLAELKAEMEDADEAATEATDDSKSKRKAPSRVSQSVDDANGSGKNGGAVKRKSNGAGGESGAPSSKIANLESANENEADDAEADSSESVVSYKTHLTIQDLEPNRLVDVKYGHGNQKSVYEAKIVQINLENNTILVHYLGWNNRYDEWVKIDKIIGMHQDDTKRRPKGSIRPFQPTPLPKTSKTPKPPTEATTPASEAAKSAAGKPVKDAEADDKAKSGAKTGEQAELRSLSTTSSGSSSSDAAPAVKDEEPSDLAAKSQPAKTTTTPNSEQKSAGKPRDSTSSASSVSLARQSSNEEAKTGGDKFEAPKKESASSAPVKTDSTASEPAHTAAAAAAGGSFLLTPLHSIKEEIMEFEPSTIAPAALSGSASPSTQPVEQLLKESRMNSRSSSISSGDHSTSHSLKEFTIKSSNTTTTATATTAPAESTETPLAAPTMASPSRPPAAEADKSRAEVPASKATSKATGKGSKAANKKESAAAAAAEAEKVYDLSGHISNVSSPASSTSSVRLKATAEPIQVDTVLSLADASGPKAQNSPSLCSISSDYSDSSSPKKACKSSSNSDLQLESKTAAAAPSPLAAWSRPEQETANKSESGAESSKKKSSSSRSVSTDEDKKKSEEVNRKETEPTAAKTAGQEETSLSNISNQIAAACPSVSSAKKPTSIPGQPMQTQNENTVVATAAVTCNNSKYSFHVINPTLLGKQRIRYIEEQMRLCREAYSKLKNEIANIDRKKKKLKRNCQLDKSAGNEEAANPTPSVVSSSTSRLESGLASAKKQSAEVK